MPSLTHLCRVDSSTLTLWTSSFPVLSCFLEIFEHNANSVDPDQRPHSVASDLCQTVCQSPFYGTLGLYGLRTASLPCKHTGKQFCSFQIYNPCTFIYFFIRACVVGTLLINFNLLQQHML